MLKASLHAIAGWLQMAGVLTVVILVYGLWLLIAVPLWWVLVRPAWFLFSLPAAICIRLAAARGASTDEEPLPAFVSRDPESFQIALSFLLSFAFWFWIGTLALFAYLSMAAIQLALANHVDILAFLTNKWILLAAILLAVGLFALKSRLPFVYGTLEINVGVTTVWAVISNGSTNVLIVCSALAGGVYVIVRGLDNASKGISNFVEQAYSVGTSPIRFLTSLLPKSRDPGLGWRPEKEYF